MANIRSPIIVVVGHSDHGKTTLLDKIRGTTVTKQEPGMLTQHTGASYVPLDVIKKISGNLLEKFKIDLQIPGLLFIDTPGHKAFLGMRKRGGSVSDLAILVVDITEGFQEQTDESLKILKESKTPFIVAATKLDRLRGWYPNREASFLDSFAKQRDEIKSDAEAAVYKIVSQLSERGFDSERFDRISNFGKQVAVVPLSSPTGEGIPDLLMVLSGLAQQFLKDKLFVSDRAKGTVLEVKEVKGLGLTIDVIIYDGVVRKGDYIVAGGAEPVVTKVKALLEPRKMQDIRTEKQFEPVDEISAAAGVKISAIGLEKVIAGSPIIFVGSEAEVEGAKAEVQQFVEEVQFDRNIDGVILCADTLGSLEAMIKILNDEGIPIKKAEAGAVSKQDVVECQNVKEKSRRAILSFNAPVSSEIEQMGKDSGIKIFYSEIIYRLIEEYKEWVAAEKSAEMKKMEGEVTHPCEVKILRGCIFRQSNPAVFGVEVQRGILRPGVTLARDGKTIDRVKGLEKEGKSVEEAKRGDKVAVSMQEATVGRHINEGDVLRAVIPKRDFAILKDIFNKLTEDEKDLLRESKLFSLE
jgi:translation initiation factor 5B